VEGTAHADPITEEVKMRVKAFIEMLADDPESIAKNIVRASLATP